MLDLIRRLLKSKDETIAALKQAAQTYLILLNQQENKKVDTESTYYVLCYP